MDSSGIQVRGIGRLRGGAVAGALLAVVAFAVAGCGGTGEPGRAVASVAATASASATASSAANPIAFAKCMRTNGIANFPDPSADGSYPLSSDIDPTSQAFKDAREKCKQYDATPPKERQTDQWPRDTQLKYAKCMRENGIPTFPDPDANGGVQLPSGVDSQSDVVKKAQQTCQKYGPQNPPSRNGGS
jgi:hypothetical protein